MLKVLLVEDSLDVQRAFGRLLATVAAVSDLACAEDVDGALRLVCTQRPDVLVLDLHLAHGDSGMAVLAQVAAHHPYIDVIVLSNALSPPTIDRCVAAGAKACFDKSTEFRAARDWIAVCRRPVAAADPSGPARH